MLFVYLIILCAPNTLHELAAVAGRPCAVEMRPSTTLPVRLVRPTPSPTLDADARYLGGVVNRYPSRPAPPRSANVGSNYGLSSHTENQMILWGIYDYGI